MTPNALAKSLNKLQEQLQKAVRLTLAEAGQLVEDEAKGMIGHEQPSWPPLAESTLKRKGLPAPGDPLLRTGVMRDSIHHSVAGNTVVIGTNDPVAEIHTHGNASVPPRPFMRPALYHKIPEIKALLQRNISTALKGN